MEDEIFALKSEKVKKERVEEIEIESHVQIFQIPL